ncbi:hypothetical protein GGX14DRAFT_562108 [Mycena pura]|uniref:Uncharacterized protein n=1 Tax=Mycena pura TaxID=153505 RepID=A0AAD6VLN5_9AGAR|nr:hypothetical protein GGX14DRAFT_562108 [Mycena pura]
MEMEETWVEMVETQTEFLLVTARHSAPLGGETGDIRAVSRPLFPFSHHDHMQSSQRPPTQVSKTASKSRRPGPLPEPSPPPRSRRPTLKQGDMAGVDGQSYLRNLTLLGNAVFISMDVPDAALALSKLLNYLCLAHAKVVSFVVFVALDGQAVNG